MTAGEIVGEEECIAMDAHLERKDDTDCINGGVRTFAPPRASALLTSAPPPILESVHILAYFL